MFSATTHDIEVTVRPAFLQDQSQPQDRHYVWMYDIQIQNKRRQSVQLMRRAWNITNAHGLCERVEGDGVVGEQPSLDPGETYQYQSGCPLDTPTGIMEGQYLMQCPDGQMLEIAIPAFSLDSPYHTRVIN